MNQLPQTLQECMSMVQTLCGQVRPVLSQVPSTRAHVELDSLFNQLDALIPDLLQQHSQLHDLFRTGEQKIRDNVAKAEQNLARGAAIQQGKVPPEEILQMQQQAFGTKFTLPPVPEMPTGWSGVLAQELKSSAIPARTLPILPTESYAWNDWHVDSNP